MESTTTITTKTPSRMAAVQGLAIVGFITLLVLGMALAIYAARYVPAALSKVATGAVYFSSIFTPAQPSQLQVVPFPATSTAPVLVAPAASTTTPAKATSTPAIGAKTPVATTPGQGSSGTYPVGGGSSSPSPATYTGVGDLSVTIVSVGYLNTDSTDSFIATTSAPSGKRPAVRFAVTNSGTNVSGVWNFTAAIPTSPSYTFTAPDQESLRPGDRVEYTLGFDRARTGKEQPITITLDPNKNTSDSNRNNNEAVAAITVQ